MSPMPSTHSGTRPPPVRSTTRLPQKLRHPLRRNLQHRCDIPASKPRPPQPPGRLPRPRRSVTLRQIRGSNRRPRRPRLLIQAPAYLGRHLHPERVLRYAKPAGNQVTGHHRGIAKTVGLGHTDAVNVQFPSVLPALSADTVGLHWSHPFARQVMRFMVSRMTPGEMVT